MSRGVSRTDGVAGNQVCIGGTGIIVEVVAGMFAAGDSIAYLAKQCGLAEADVEDAVRAVVSGAFGPRGLPVKVTRKMEAMTPLQSGD